MRKARCARIYVFESRLTTDPLAKQAFGGQDAAQIGNIPHTRKHAKLTFFKFDYTLGVIYPEGSGTPCNQEFPTKAKWKGCISARSYFSVNTHSLRHSFVNNELIFEWFGLCHAFRCKSGSRYVEGYWGPLTWKYLDLVVYQDSTIVKFCLFGKNSGEPIDLDPRKMKHYLTKVCFAKHVWFNRSCWCFKSLESSNNY